MLIPFYIQNIEMGGSETYPRSFVNRQQDLTFYMEVKDHNLGQVEIFTSKKMPLCYILRISRSINDSKIYNLFQKIENAQSPYLVSLYGFQMQRHKCCDKIMGEAVVSYWEYYNFYFADYLRNRNQSSAPFLETQFWHVIQTCCEAFIILRKNNCFYDFSPKTMVITPEGKLKIFWAHLMSQNKHLKYFKYFDHNLFEPHYFSPEELELIHSKQLTNKLNFDKCNAFGLGMILIQCLTLTDSLKTCYTYNMSRINFKAINNIIQTKVAPYYSSDLTNLLRQLLDKDPKQRISLQKVQQQYSHLMNDDYQLRVCGAKKPEPTQKYDMYHQQLKNKQSDLSDAKTVKLAHTNRKD